MTTQQTLADFLDSQDFYELMQAYRHEPLDAAKQFEAVRLALYAAIALPVQPPVTDDRAAFEVWAAQEGLNIQKAKPRYDGDVQRSRFGLCPATYYFDEAECAWRAWANKPAPLPLLPAPLVPLTDANLCVILLQIDCETKRLPPGFKEFARAIEAAHGIKQ